MKAYRIYTGTNYPLTSARLIDCVELIEQRFDGCTIEEGKGRWHKKWMFSTTFIIGADSVVDIHWVAYELGVLLEQDQVAIEEDGKLYFVEIK